ncbi:MAG: hypothetical protein ABSH35_25965 [Isosphaeraceae bacterium]|jgi:hypothetical protein
MRFEILIQFIVPLMFLAIWALTSLLNRDAQPLPPRPGRPPGAGGPRPLDLNRMPGQPEPRSSGLGSLVQAPASSPLADQQTMWPGATSAPTARERAVQRPPLQNMEDAIVYIENDPTRRGTTRPASSPGPAAGASSGSRLPRAAQQRKGTRGRAGTTSSAPGQGRAEPKTHRALSDQVNQSMALQRNKPLEITPLFTSLAPLSLPLSQASVAPRVQQERGTANPVTLSGLDIRKMLSSPGKLREFALLTEVLQPPVSLRPRGIRH